MPEPLRPASAKTYGRSNWAYLPAVSGFATGLGPTVSEITGASALDISRIVFADGAPAPTQNTNLVDQNRRFADTDVSQFVGTTTYAGGQMTYQFDPQSATGSDGVKLWEKFLNSTGTISGFFVRRQNVQRATAFTAGQFVDVFKVEIGPSMPTESGQGEAAEAAAMATFAVVEKPLFKVAIQA